MEAFLLLSDKSGAVKLEVVWGDDGQKFSPASNAHRMMAALIKHADTIAGRIPVQEPPLNAVAQVRYSEALALAEGLAQPLPG